MNALDSDLRQRMIAPSLPCVMKDSEGLVVEFPDLPALIVDKALNVLESEGFVVVHHMSLFGDAIEAENMRAFVAIADAFISQQEVVRRDKTNVRAWDELDRLWRRYQDARLLLTEHGLPLPNQEVPR